MKTSKLIFQGIRDAARALVDAIMLPADHKTRSDVTRHREAAVYPESAMLLKHAPAPHHQTYYDPTPCSGPDIYSFSENELIRFINTVRQYERDKDNLNDTTNS